MPKLTWSDTPCANGHIGWRRVLEGSSKGKKYRHTKCEQCRKDNRAKHRKKDLATAKRTLINTQLRRLIDGKRCHKRQTGSEKLLGCSIQFYRCYIEAQFTPEMTWSGWGTVWQIDHITECHTFDLTDPAQIQKCFHFTNTRPRITANNTWQGKNPKLTV